MIHAAQNYVKRKFYRLKFPSTNVKRKNRENEKDLLFLKYQCLEVFLAFFNKIFLLEDFRSFLTCNSLHRPNLQPTNILLHVGILTIYLL